MNSFLATVVSNVVIAALLAVVALVLTKLWRNPHFAHAMWLLVLLKLVTPPLVYLPLPFLKIESGQSVTATEGERGQEYHSNRNSIAAAKPLVQTPGPVQMAEGPRLRTPKTDAKPAHAAAQAKPAVALQRWKLHWTDWLLLLSGGGTIVLASMAFRRHRRLLFVIAAAREADPALREEAGIVSQRMGVRSCPPVLVTDAIISPLVIIGGWNRLILLPASVLAEIDREQVRSILAHELAHLRRRDHWVRYFELLVLALFWWNPVVWWAGRKLHEAEEECCDAWVVWAYPESRRSYGQALLRTAEVLTEGPLIRPIGGIGLGTHRLTRRIGMIMKHQTSHRMSRRTAAAILMLGIAVLPLTTAGHSEEPPAKQNDVKATDAVESKDDADRNEALPAMFAKPTLIKAGQGEPIAWGTPGGGLQAGLRVVGQDIQKRDGKYVAVGGVPLKIEVIVRNVTDKPIAVEYPVITSFFYTDGPVIKASPASFAPSKKTSLNLAPLAPVRIGHIHVGHHRPKRNTFVDSRPFWTNAGPGNRHIGCTNVLRPPGTKTSLNTGFIDVFLVPPPPQQKLRDPEDNEVISRLEGIGGQLTFSGDDVIAVDLFKTAATDRELVGVRRFPKLVGLTLTGTNITDDGLAQLQILTGLGDLGLADTRITDCGLAHLEDFKRLEYLSLGKTKVTDDGLVHLQPLQNLVMLNLTDTQIGDGGLAHLGEFPKLSTLSLSGTQITDEGLKHLRNLKSVHDIRLDDTAVGDVGLKHLKEMSQLKTVVLNSTAVTGKGFRFLPDSVESLWLPKTKVNDEGLKHLSRLKQLEKLILSGTPVTDEGLKPLRTLENLREVDLTGTQVTDAGVEQLQDALPFCRIHR